MRETGVVGSRHFALTSSVVGEYMALLRGGGPARTVPVNAPAPPLVGVVAAQHEARRVLTELLAETGATGLVQVGYTSDMRRGIRVGEVLAVDAGVEHRKATSVGRFVDLCVSLVAPAEEPVGGFRAELLLFSQDELGRARQLGLFDRRRKRGSSISGDDVDDGTGRSTFVLDAATIRRYATVAGDDNPVHLDEGEARRLGLPTTIAHGMLVLGVAVDRVLASLDPNLAFQVRSVRARFTRPVATGEAVTATWSHRPTPHGELLAFRVHTTSGVAIKGGFVELMLRTRDVPGAVGAHAEA